jgi:hypothetical protein
MRIALRTFLLLALASGAQALAGGAQAIDLTGTWWGKAITGAETHPIWFIFVQQGNTFRGTGGPSRVDQAIMQNGRIERGRVIFDVLPGGASPLHFELVPDGDKLNGTVKVKHNGQIVTGQVTVTKRTD